jgi:gentisate 1,2-dioxygenase
VNANVFVGYICEHFIEGIFPGSVFVWYILICSTQVVAPGDQSKSDSHTSSSLQTIISGSDISFICDGWQDLVEQTYVGHGDRLWVT